MSIQQPGSLEQAIRDSGEGWLIDSYSPPSAAMDHLRGKLAEIQRRARERLGESAPELTESSLVREYARNPLKVKGFFQALGGTRSPEMLLMAWRIIEGLRIKEFRLSYRRREALEMTAVLESPSGEEDPPYTSSSIRDFALFHHIGILEISGTPAFEGFYPLRLKD
jgi:hypothetical protein